MSDLDKRAELLMKNTCELQSSYKQLKEELKEHNKAFIDKIEAQSKEIELLKEKNKQLEDKCCLIAAIDRVYHMSEQLEHLIELKRNKRARTTVDSPDEA